MKKTRRARIAPCHISLVAFVHWTTESHFPYLMNDRKSTTVVSYHAAMKYSVKIVEKKMKLLL